MSAIDTQKRLETAYGHGDADELRTVIHDDCVVSSLAIGDAATIRGREAVVAELVARASSNWMFQTTFDAYRELDEDTLLITGAVGTSLTSGASTGRRRRAPLRHGRRTPPSQCRRPGYPHRSSPQR